MQQLPTKWRRIEVLAAIAAFAFCFEASAHHSPAPFDLARTAEIEGVVTRFMWRNPHVYIDVEAVRPDGQIGVYSVEASWPAGLLDHGWTRDTLGVGDYVTVSGNPARDPNNLVMLGRSIIVEGIPQPLVLYDFPGTATPFEPSDSPDRASMAPLSALIGTWQPVENFNIVPLAPENIEPLLTESGKAAVAAMQAANEGELAAAQCRPHSPPFNMLFQEAKAFESRDDDIVLRLAVDGDIERTVHMTDDRPRGSSEDGQGHSSGRWEGSTLIVATTFEDVEDSESRDIVGIPATGTQVTERFELSDDRNRLEYSFVVENAGYLSRPIEGGVAWGFRDDLEVLRLECDPESASRFLGE